MQGGGRAEPGAGLGSQSGLMEAGPSVPCSAAQLALGSSRNIIPAHEPRGAEDHSLWHEALCLQWARRPGRQERGCAASSTSLSVCLSHTNRHTIREEDSHRQDLGAVRQCDEVATRWGPRPIFGVTSTRNRGEVLASPGVGKKGSEVNRCQRRGVGRGGGCLHQAAIRKSRLAPRLRRKGWGP